MFLFLGLIARAPQLDLGGVMLLVAAFAQPLFLPDLRQAGLHDAPPFPSGHAPRRRANVLRGIPLGTPR